MMTLNKDEIVAAVKQGLIDPAYLRDSNEKALTTAEIADWIGSRAFKSHSTAAIFDSKAYLQRYRDVATAPMHPVFHYIRYGMKEGRHAFPTIENVLSQLKDAEPRKIWIETHDLSITGAPMALSHILRGLPEVCQNARVGSATPGPLQAQFGDLTNSILVHGICARRAHSAVGLAFLADLAAKLLQFSGAEKVLANSFLSWPFVLGAQQLGIPVIWIIHEPNPSEMSEIFAPDVMSHLATKMTEVDHLIFVSEESRLEWNAHTIPKAQVIEKKLPNTPLGSRERGRKASRCGPADCLLLSVGTLSPRKGQEDLVSALEALLAQGGLPNLVAVVVGFTNSPYSKALQTRLTRLKSMGLRLIMLPQSKTEADRRIVEDLFAASDIFVMTSRAESLPITTDEALICGCPVISTSARGVGNKIREGVNGFLYEPGDVGALATHILTILRGNGSHQRPIANMQIDVKNNDYATMIKQYEGILMI